MILPDPFNEEEGLINVIIETPSGSRNKYTYEKENDLFRLKKILPEGTSFPFDFGFIPKTKGGDGDPLDVMVFSDEASFPGCLLECRILGVIEAEQKSKKEKSLRNDRILAVENNSMRYNNLSSINDLNEKVLEDILNFFKYYNKMEKREFKLIRVANKKNALKILKSSLEK
jgi:inorganic pyrophosphatase